MTYVYLNYDNMKGVVRSLNSYAESAESAFSGVSRQNDYSNGVVDLSAWPSGSEKIQDLRDKAGEIDARVELAKLQNEEGITLGSGDEIAYYLPDHVEDNVANINSAREGTEDGIALKDFVKNGEERSIEEWNALRDRIRGHKSNASSNRFDPAYASGFIDAIGPDGMLDLPAEVTASLGEKYPDSPSLSGPRYVYYKHPEVNGELTDLFGGMLSAASPKWGNFKGRKFADQLADAVTDGDNGTRMAALNAILSTKDRESSSGETALDYNDAMLIRLAGRLEEREDSPSDQQRLALSNLYASGGSTESLPGVVRAMSANPLAAQDWLLPKDANSDPKELSSRDYSRSKSDRIRGLVGRSGGPSWIESWSIIGDHLSQGHGQANTSFTEPARGTSDRQARVSPATPGSSEDIRTSIIMSGILDGVGDQLMPGREGVLTDRAKDSLSLTMMRYPVGVQESTKPQEVDESDPTKNKESSVFRPRTDGIEGYSQPVLSKSALRNLLAFNADHAVGGSGPTLADKIRDYQTEQIINNCQNSSSGNEPRPLQNAINDYNRTAGFIGGSREYHEIARASIQDDRESDLVDVTAYLINKVPAIGGDLSTFGSALAKERLGLHQTTAATLAIGRLDNDYDTSSDHVMRTLLEGNYFSQEELLAIYDSSQKSADYLFKVTQGENGDREVELIFSDDADDTEGLSEDEKAEKANNVDDALDEAAEVAYFPGSTDTSVLNDSRTSFKDGYNSALGE